VTPGDLRDSVAGALKAAMAPAPHPILVPLGGYGTLLEHVRQAIRQGQLDKVETLLMRAADLAGRDPAYFNLLGVLYEFQGDERLARKFYGKAITARKDYEPAQQNMRRLYELMTYGHSDDAVALGDEADLLSEWGTPIGG
jgi:Flp pilus assembly protein TadD